ncbi:tyrosine-protein phosphatase [Flavobacterium sp. JP2137]|uniref:tyrosine-protein phosphatase n=1 Tax=Flavobacterium sp. JP2137 TaxID=3414510 RepID=UPI003D2FD5D8
MIKRVFVLTAVVGVITSCAYKPVQSPRLSALSQAPIIVENKSNYELHVNEAADQQQLLYTSNAVLTKQKREDEAVLAFSKEPSRLMVQLKIENGDTLVLQNRRIYFKKTPNFRDIGGLKTSEGRTLRWGKIFRSGQLNGVKKKELKTIENLDIRTLVDLRTPAEVDKKPDKYPASTQYYKFNAFEEEQDQLAQTRKAVFKGKINAEESVALLQAFYSYYPTEDTEVIREIIHTLLDQDGAVLFHCSAGKDRTGIIGALILSILKVDRETIYQDYLLSNNYRKAGIEKQLRWIKIGRLIYPGLNQEVVENFSWINDIYLKATFDQIDAKYGSMDNYIHRVLRISESQRQGYIDKFTY